MTPIPIVEIFFLEDISFKAKWTDLYVHIHTHETKIYAHSYLHNSLHSHTLYCKTHAESEGVAKQISNLHDYYQRRILHVAHFILVTAPFLPLKLTMALYLCSYYVLAFT